MRISDWSSDVCSSDLTRPKATRERYLDLHREAQAIQYPEIDAMEASQGFAIDRGWMSQLALHTQVVIKQSRLNYNHGRLLYAVLRRYLADCRSEQAVLFVTGPALGFPAPCLAPALHVPGAGGHVMQVDPPP